MLFRAQPNLIQLLNLFPFHRCFVAMSRLCTKNVSLGVKPSTILQSPIVQILSAAISKSSVCCLHCSLVLTYLITSRYISNYIFTLQPPLSTISVVRADNVEKPYSNTTCASHLLVMFRVLTDNLSLSVFSLVSCILRLSKLSNTFVARRLESVW